MLGAVIALLLGGHADGTLLDLVCAGGCGVLLWEKLVALSETLCTQIESWNRFLLGFLPVYAGVLTLGGESVARRFGRRFSSDAAVCSGAGAHGAGAAAAPMLSGLEHGLLHLCGNRAGELLQGGWPCAGKAAGMGGQTSGCSFGSGAHLNAATGPCGPSHRAASDRTVPIIGETLRDASETVLSCLQLLKSGLGLAALLTIAAEFVPVYLGMLIQLGLLSGCGLLCGMMAVSAARAFWNALLRRSAA